MAHDNGTLERRVEILLLVLEPRRRRVALSRSLKSSSVDHNIQVLAMSRTPLFAGITKALARSSLDSLGSYASAKVGQYTTMLEVASEPALHGRLQFVGEHTSSDFLGYTNGGVQSGNRAAAALIKTMALHK